MSEGYIKINRKILEWRWFKDPVTRAVFEYLLLSANWHDASFRGVEVKRGQALRSIKTIAEDNGISERQARTALNHLKATSEVTSEATSSGTLITIENYSVYQGGVDESDKLIDKLLDKRATSETAKSDKQATTYKKNKKNINNNNKYLEKENKERESSSLLQASHEAFAALKVALQEATN